MPQSTPVADENPSQRTIKKYPNRRLYDTETSAYITFLDLKQLVMQRQAFVVREAKSGEDVTRSVLLQILLDEEAGGAPMFTERVLENLIRFYGHAMQGFMGPYIEKNVQAFTEMHAKLADHAHGATPELWAQFMSQQPPVINAVMGSYLEQSGAALGQMREQMQKQADQMLGAFTPKR